jgi:integrase
MPLLTALRVNRLVKPGRYHDGLGLYLQVGSPTNRSWIYRFERGGREFVMGLGSLKKVSLAEARAFRHKYELQLVEGINPLHARNAKQEADRAAAAKAKTFLEAAQEFFDSKSEGYSRKHAAQWSQSVLGKTLAGKRCAPEHSHCASLARLPVAAIGRADVLRVIEPLWTSKPEVAKRVRIRIAHVLDWATFHEYRAGPNPAQWKGGLEHAGLPERKAGKHFKALDYRDLPAFFAALAERPRVEALALRFLILTAARTDEVLGAKWSEINLDEKEAAWTVPGGPSGRMKEGEEHRIPLSAAALDILRSLPREQGSDFVFIGPRTGMPCGPSTLRRVLERMGVSESADVHGFRATFRTWAGESTSHAPDTIEMSLSHKVGNAVERAYNRGQLFDKRRRLMDEWAAYCTHGEAAGGKVVPLRREG